MAANGKRAEKNGSAAELAGVLADAIRRSAHHRTDPIVVIDRIDETNNAHVVVIWDRWDEAPAIQRRKTILEAFKASKALPGTEITSALGVTCLEAFESGLLPYGIIAMHRQADGVPLDKLTKAMDEEEEGVHVTVGSSTQLRFPTLDQAEDAYRRLSTHVPGPYWAIVQEVRT